jgi:O-antigen/teichoic acid export membrane protein
VTKSQPASHSMSQRSNLIEENQKNIGVASLANPLVMDDNSLLSKSPPVDQEKLDRSLVHGVAWTGIIKWVSNIIAWVGSLVVARLLSPDDYGLVGMATVYMGFVSLLNEFGLGSVVIVYRKLTDEQIKQLNTFSVLLGLAFFAISYVASIPLAIFFKTSQLRWVVVAMSTAFMVSAFQIVPNALLRRDLQFKTLALIDGIQAVVQSSSMVVFALIGFRYWTLVLGGLLGTMVSTVLVCTRRMQPFAWPHTRGVRAALDFSGDVVIGRISWYVSENADFLVAGRFLGKAALGAYSYAWTLAGLPLERISSLINRVLPSIFSAVQDEMASMRRYLLTITEGLALITFPIAFGTAVVSDELVPFVLGEKWRGAILPLRLLSAYGAFRSIYTFIPYVLFNTGHIKFWKWNSVLSAALLPISFYIGSYWGTGGIAAAWMIVHPFLAMLNYWRAFRTIKLSLLEYLKSILPALWGSLCMVCVVMALKLVVTRAWPLPARLGIEVLGGAVTYLSVLFICHRGRLTSFYQFLRKMRSN